MRAATFLVLMLIGLAVARSDRFGSFGLALSPITAAAAQQKLVTEPPVERLSVARPNWHRAAGLLIADMTINNRNAYPVKDVIVGCDFFDEWGAQIGTRGTAIRRVFRPGATRIRGVEFPLPVRNMQGGACRVLSAKRF